MACNFMRKHQVAFPLMPTSTVCPVVFEFEVQNDDHEHNQHLESDANLLTQKLQRRAFQNHHALPTYYDFRKI